MWRLEFPGSFPEKREFETDDPEPLEAPAGGILLICRSRLQEDMVIDIQARPWLLSFYTFVILGP